LEEVDHLGCVLGGYILSLSLSSVFLFFWSPRDVWLCFSMPFHHDVLPHHGPETMEPSEHGLKPLKLEFKVNPCSFKLFLLGICHSGGGGVCGLSTPVQV
jgi:hypothetical protein